MIEIEKNQTSSYNHSNRYKWLDIIKAICIITVVLFHINYKSFISLFNIIWEYLDRISGLYKVTIFYCIAGITLNNDKIKKTFKFLFDKFKKVYLKVIIIGIIAVLFHNVFINMNFYKLGYSYSGKIMSFYNIKSFFINIILTFTLANREVILGAVWFVYSLLICFIILSLIELIISKISFIKQKRECRLFLTFLLMFLSIFISNYFGVTIPRFSNSLVGLFLLDLTNYLYTYKIFDKKNIYFIFGCLICFLLAPFFGRISMNTSFITSPYFLLVVFAVLYLLIIISKKMEKINCLNFLQYIGENSFSIMAFHFIGFKIGGLFLNILGFNVDISLLVPEAYNIFIVFYYLVFGISISLLIAYILKKLFKFKL